MTQQQIEEAVLGYAALMERVAVLEQKVAHLNGEPTDKDVNDIIENGLEKESFKNEAR